MSKCDTLTFGVQNSDTQTLGIHDYDTHTEGSYSTLLDLLLETVVGDP